jgi:ribosomal protein S18 acetylase RimI-like enzyme
MVRLAPMSPEEYQRFITGSTESYAQEHVRAGTWTEAESLDRAREEIRTLLPSGLETPDHFLRVILDEATGERAGELWFALQHEVGAPQLFVFWIGIDEPYRRRGFASATFHLLEQEARDRGAVRVALHVFGDNLNAQALYRKLGYVPTNIQMAKPV